eukprot:TRINITY_DN71210_c1_g1_i1.p2 TRINITY_DN71210_c1_g1~~TRINITY_DN71210_c1_g1_i1.p2  ORF type:complete len:335 (-),score=31.48 TRINITY_DN71210_c1_g1_i1:1217-2221(-)
MNNMKKLYPEIQADPTFILFKDYDEQKVLLSRPGLPKRYFKDLLRVHEYPIVNQCTEKVLSQLEKLTSSRSLILLLHSENDENLEQLKKDFKELATEKRSKEQLFIMSNVTEGPCKSFATDKGIDTKKLPTLQIIEIKNWEPQRYAYNGPFSFKRMKRFYEDWKQGSAKREYKSEEPPANNPGPVYTVVGKTFDEMVIKPNQDVFVKFYAPWCGHCKHLAPIYEELSKKLEKNKNVKLVEIDSTKNEIPGITIGGYPTLKLFKASDKKNPIQYDGPRTVEEMERFLKAHSSFNIGVKSDLQLTYISDEVLNNMSIPISELCRASPMGGFDCLFL